MHQRTELSDTRLCRAGAAQMLDYVATCVTCRAGGLSILLAAAASSTRGSDSSRPASRRWLALCWAASIALGVGCHLGLELGLKAASFDSRRPFIEGEGMQLLPLLHCCSRRAARRSCRCSWHASLQHPVNLTCAGSGSSPTFLIVISECCLELGTAYQTNMQPSGLLSICLRATILCGADDHAPIERNAVPLLRPPSRASHRMAAQPGVLCDAGRGAARGGGGAVADRRPAPPQPLRRRRRGDLHPRRPPAHRPEVSGMAPARLTAQARGGDTTPSPSCSRGRA